MTGCAHDWPRDSVLGHCPICQQLAPLGWGPLAAVAVILLCDVLFAVSVCLVVALT